MSTIAIVIALKVLGAIGGLTVSFLILRESWTRNREADDADRLSEAYRYRKGWYTR